MGRLTRTILTMIIAVFMVVTNILTPNTRAVTTVNAAAGDVPAHAKFRGNNGDGTYKLALNVTGESEKIYTKTNVIVILDISGSMDRAAGGSTRMAAAKNAVNHLANTLLSENGQNGQPADLFEMALVTFSNVATKQRFGNSDKTASYSTYSQRVNGLNPVGGTNWEDAMAKGNDVNFNDTDQTFVIFVSDGNPTFRMTEGNYPNHYNDYNQQYYNDYGVWGSGSDTGNSAATTIARCYEHAVDDAQTLATKVGANRFFTIGAYGSVDRMESLTTAVGAPAANYFNAADTTALEAAFAAIMEQIANAGIAEVEIQDQTTASVATSSGVSHLLTVDASSFKYYRAGGRNDDGTTKYSPTANTMSGIAAGETSYNTKNLGVEWTAADDPAPPAATVNANGEVEWDLSSLDVLENGVTYTVTFDVYPSQETYDLIAELKNGTKTYSQLPAEIRQYLSYDEATQSFSLETNKTATLNYDDTRTEAAEAAVTYPNPPAVPTEAQEMDIEKEWIGEYSYIGEDGIEHQEQLMPVTLQVIRNGDEAHPYETITLDNTTGYKGAKFIATGLMRVNEETGAVQVLDTGYDYELKEIGEVTYHWEFVADTLHPMVINGTLVNLKVVEDADIPQAMKDDTTLAFYNDNGTKYYRFENNGKMEVYTASGSSTALSAKNVRRSNLNLTKKVTGNDAPADTYFTFKMNLKNPSNATEDFYFSIWNDGYVVNQEIPADQWAEGSTLIAEEGFTVTGATLEQNEDGKYTGYYVARPNTDVTVTLKDGWNLRFTNVLTGTTYSFEEMTPLANGFEFVDAVLTAKDESTGGSITVEPIQSALAVSGTVKIGNAAYTVTYTNRYNPVELTPQVTKAVTGWDAIEAFSFSLAAADDVTRTAVTQGHVVINGATAATAADIKKDASETVDFANITFYREGTYKFTFDETTTTTAKGWTYDAATHDMTVVVVADENGQLSISSDTGNNPTFTNSYVPEPVDAEIPVLKNVTPDTGLTPADITGRFTFTLAPVNGAPMPADGTTTVVCGPSGQVVKFPAIEYTAAGTYAYTITESVTPGQDAGGIELETADPKTITVVVTDDGSGQLAAVVNGNVTLAFNNPYHVTPINITIPVNKILEVPENLDGPEDITGKYTFTLATTDGAPLPKTTSMTNPAKNGGSIVFGSADDDKITITQPGTYTYTVTERGSVPGVTNDATATKTIVFTVTDDGNGGLTYTTSPETDIEFTNTYDAKPVTAAPYAAKILSGEGEEKPDVSGKYTFTLTAVTEGAPMPAAGGETAVNPDGDGTAVAFGSIQFTAPGVYEYKVTETGTVEGVVNDSVTERTLTITVTDNKEGQLTAVVSADQNNPVTFTNTYHETSVTIPVTKILDLSDGTSGPDDITGKFTFTLAAVTEGAPMPETTVLTNPSADGGSVVFGAGDDKIIYDEPGTYEYTVTETGNVPGVENDKEATKTVTVAVVRNDDGSLTATVTSGEVKFTNTYVVEPTEVSFPVLKVLEVPAGLTAPDITEAYDIILVAEEGTPMPTVTTYKNPDADGGMVTFGAITYDKPGTYTYTVREAGDIPGVTNEPAAVAGKTVTVTVTDNKNGRMTAVASSTDANPVTFTNKYSVGTISATPAVHKDLVYDDGLTPPDITEKYTFTLTGKNGAPMPEAGGETVKNPASDGGTVSFGTITYSEPGTYEYEVTEAGNVPGVTNDPVTPKTFTVTVTDNSDGTLSAVIDYGNNAGHVIFTNEYKVEPTTVSFPVKKVLEVPDGLTAPDINEKYTIKVVGADGAPMPAVTEYKNPASDGGTVTFGTIEFTEPGTYTYTVSEEGTVAGVINDPDAAGKTVTVTVTDNSDGTMTAEASSTPEEPVTFTNKYDVEPESIKDVFKKSIAGWRPGAASETFSFTLTAGEGSPAPEKTAYDLVATAAGTYTLDFGAIEFTAPGTYTYTLTEDITNLDGGWVVTNNPVTLTVTVTDNSDGTLNVSAAPVTIENKYDVVTVEGTKTWNDTKYYVDGEPVDGYVRPDVTINLKADGTVIDTATATEQGGWNYSFTDLPKYKDHGTEINYTIEEVLPDGYTNEVNEYDVINTPVDDEEILNPIELTILKVDELTGTRTGLAGAVFTLTAADETVKGTYTTGTDGTVVVKFEQGGVEDGEYVLKETTAPTGYELNNTEFKVVVEKNFVTVQLNEDKSLWQWIYDLIFNDETKAQFEYDENTFTLVVPDTPEVTNVKGTKIWEDDTNRDRVRPTEVTYQLYKTVNGTDTKVEGKTVTITGGVTENTWTSAEIADLPAYEDGYPVTYWFVELTAQGTEVTEGGKLDDNYSARYSDDKLTVTNSYTPDVTEVPFKKVWNDADDTLGVRPTEITVWLMDGINQLNEQVVTKDMNWEYTFTTDADGNPLPKNRDGQPINYTVAEKEVKPYEGAVIGIDDDGRFIIENRLEIPPVKDVFEEGKLDTSIDGQPVAIGDKLTYTINYKNTTGAEAEVTITDKIPEHTTFESADNGGTFADGTVTWVLTVADKSEITVSFTVTVDDYQGAVLPNTAVVRVGENGSETNEVVNYVPTDPVKDVFYTSAPTVSIDGEQVQRGDELLYKIDYKNTTGAKTTVTVTDTIPEHTTLVSADNDGKYDDATRTITWTGIEVENGEGLTVSFIVTVDEDVNGEVLVNKARVEDGVNDKDTNEVINPTPTQPEKDVFTEGDTTTSIDGKPVNVGDKLTYQIKYKNTTGKDATVTITDEIPAFTEFVSADNSGAFADGKVTWTLDVANDAEVTVSFVVTVTEEAEGEKLLNDAEVQEGENKYTTNEVVNYVPTDPIKDVFYTSDPTVSIDGEQVQRGEELLYKILYTNTTGAATTVTITDEIPEHTTFVSADNGGAYDDATRTVTWTGIQVENDNSLTVSFIVTVDDDVNGEVLANDADVDDGVNKSKTNEVINPTPTQPEKDVFTEGGTTTSIDGKPVNVGDNLTYQIKYKNTTGKDATVTITDVIPEFTEFVSADNSGAFADGKVTWTLDVANGEEIIVSFVVTVTEEAEGEKLLNDAEVQEGENKYTTNEVVNYVPTDPVKDVFYTSDPTVSIDGEQVQRGEELLYKIDYVNTTGDKTTVTVTDTIPEHTTFVSADNGGTYDDATRTITWTGIEVAYEDSLTVSFVVTVDDDVNGEKLINKARVEDGVNDKDTNEVINPTPTQPEKDVFTPADTTTSIDGRKAEPGDELLYKITYKNTTGKDADVTIEDAIPEYTTYVEGSADYNGTFADNKVTWTLNVKNDEEITVSFKVKVNDDAVSEPVYNDAIVREGKNEYTTNEVVNTIPTPPVKDVFYSDDLTTSIDGEQVKAGEQLTYVITYTNTTGEKEPADVTITDVLPQYTTFVEATEGGTYDEATNTVTWTLVVNNGETVNVAFSVKVDDDAEDVKIPNTAKVRKGENEYETNEVVNYVPKEPVKEIFTATSETNIDGNKVEPGDELTYKITYKNATGKEAEVTIEDEIPQFTTYVEGSADNNGVYADGKITWTMTLAYEEEITVSFKVKVNEDAAGEEVVNDALVREGENEYTTNEVVNSIPTPPTKDVFYSDDLTTSIDGKQVKPGEQLTYVITYTNTTGAKEPAEVTITDKLPQYTEFVEATEGGTFADGVVTWNLTVPNGETVKVAFSVKVADDADGVRIPNTAKVRKGENEYDTNEVVNYVPGEPVKEVYKSSDTTTSIDGKTVQPGDELTYKISYTNATGKEAEVTIEDAIPQFTTYVDGSADNCGVYADGKITWTLTVPYEGSVTVSFKVTVNADSEGEKVVNDAKVREGENEYTTNEVVNTIPTPPVKDVFTPADTTTSIDGKEVKSGDHLMYAITYKNTTGADADVTITDKIPAHTTFVNAQNDGVFADGTVTWNLKVKDGESVTVTFVVKVDNVTQAVEIPNTAHVIDGANEYDTNEVINTVPYVPKTGDEADYRAFRMHCFTLAGSLMVFLAALIIMIINRKKEEEFFAKK